MNKIKTYFPILGHLQVVGKLAVQNYRSLAAGERVQVARRRMYQERDRQIAAAISSYDDGRLTIIEFLRQAAHYFDPVDENHIELHGHIHQHDNEVIILLCEQI